MATECPCRVWYRAGSCILPRGHKGQHVNQEQTEMERLRERLRIVTEECRIATEVLTEISHCGCSACGPAPRDLKHAQTMAGDALVRMSVVE